MTVRGVPRTKAEQVADYLRAEVARKQPGDQLPTQRELMDRFGFASQTVQNGLAMARAEGLVVSAGNLGNFVADSDGPITDVREEVKALRAQVVELAARLDAVEGRGNSK